MLKGMILTSLVKRVGAPLLEKFITNRLGEPVGEMVGPVVDMIAGELGVPNTEEAIERDYQADPERVTEVIQSVQSNPRTMELYKSYLSILSADTSSEDWFTRNWRPMAALGFAASTGLTITTSCFGVVWALTHTVDLSGVMPLVGLVVPALTVWAGVVGVYVHGRTQEKLGVARS